MWTLLCLIAILRYYGYIITCSLDCSEANHAFLASILAFVRGMVIIILFVVKTQLH